MNVGEVNDNEDEFNLNASGAPRDRPSFFSKRRSSSVAEILKQQEDQKTPAVRYDSRAMYVCRMTYSKILSLEKYVQHCSLV